LALLKSSIMPLDPSGTAGKYPHICAELEMDFVNKAAEKLQRIIIDLWYTAGATAQKFGLVGKEMSAN